MLKTAGADALARYAKRSGCEEQVRDEHAGCGLQAAAREGAGKTRGGNTLDNSQMWLEQAS